MKNINTCFNFTLILFLLISFDLSSQVIWTNLTTKTLNKCSGQDTFRIQVQNKTGASISSVTIRPTLPSGITVISNSIKDSTTVFPGGNGGITWNGTDFVIGNAMPNLAQLDFYFVVKASCSAASGSLTATYALRSNGTQVSVTGTSDPFTVKSAVLSITGLDSTIMANKIIGYSFPQKIKITNGGQGLIDSFYINLVNTAVTISNLQVVGGSAIATATLSTGGIVTVYPSTSLGQNQSIELTYNVTIAKCTPTTRSLTAYWGCGGSTCQTSSAVVSDFSIRNTVAMTVSGKETSTPLSPCMINLTRTYETVYKNNSNAPIKLRQLYFGSCNDAVSFIATSWSQTDYIDLTSVYVIPPASSGVAPYFPTSNYVKVDANSNAYNTNGISICNNGKPISAKVVWGLAAVAANDTTFSLNPGDSIIVRYNRIQCDNSSNSCLGKGAATNWVTRSGIYYYISNEGALGNYYDQCYNVNNQFSGISPKSYLHNSVNVNFTEAPAQVAGVSTFSYVGSYYMNANAIPAITKRYYQADLTLPPGVTYVPNSYAIISNSNLEPGYPKYTPSGSGGVLSIRFAYSGSTSISPYFKLTLQSDGTSCGNQLLKTSITAVVDSSCSNAYSTMCYNDTIDFVCPVNCLSSFPNSVIYERSNIGLPDTNNDGFADLNAVVDRNKMSLNYLRGGDTLRIYSKNAIYVDSPNYTSWAIVQADHRFDTGSWRPAGNPNIILKRGNTSYAISGTNAIQGTKNRDFVLSWGSSVPPAWGNYLAGDTVIVEQFYLFQMNSRDALINNSVLNCKVTGTVYTSQGSIANTNYTYNNASSNKYSCLSTKYNLKLVGHNGAYIQNNITLSNGCTNNLTYQVLALQDQNNPYSFPYEYRPTLFADTFIVTLPTGYNFAKTTGFGFSQQSAISIAQLDSCRQIIGNKLYYFLKAAREKLANPYPNENNNQFINFELAPTNYCFANSFSFNTTVKYRFFDFSVNRSKDSIENFVSSGVVTDVNKPVLSATALPSTQSPSSGTATYKLDISNIKSQASTAKVWVYFRNKSSNTSFTNVKFNNIVQTPNSKGYYALSTIGANSTISAYLDISLQSCNASQVVAYYGLECNAPTTDLDSISCKDSFVLTINPVDANYQATLYPLNGGTNYDFCNPFSVEFELSSTVLGDIKNVAADVTLPNGISYVPGSVQFKIPSNAATYTTSSYNPTQTGNLLHFDLTKNSGLGINTDSLMKGVYDITKNTIKVKYQVKSACGANEGETIKHTFSAKKSCGESLTSIISETLPMVFSNLVGPGYTTDPSKSKIDTISNCISTDLYVNILNLGALPSQSLDSIRITLPYTARYVGYVNSGANTKNAPNSNPTIKYNSDSSAVLSWQMTNNVSKDDSILFVLKIKPSPILKTFQNTNILIATGRSISLSCNSVTCDIFKLNGYSNIPLVIKSLPTIGAFTGDSFICKNETTTIGNSASGGVWSSSNTTIATVNSSSGFVTPVDTGKVYIKYSVTNSGSCTNIDSVRVLIDSVPTVASITGDFEVCTNDSSQLSIASSGGTWSSSNTAVATISNLGMVKSIKPGTTLIKYVGAKSSKGCYDSTSITFVVDSLPTLTITNPSAICSPSTIDLTASAVTTGSKANANGSLTYSYWVDSIATIAISSPNTSNAIQDSGKYYIKAINSNGCSVSSGVIVEINKLPTLTITNPSAICSPETIDLTASAITSGSSPNTSGSITYSYWKDSSATVAISSPNTSNAIQDSGKYYIKAVNSKGCSVSSGVIVEINKLPTLTITNPSAICSPGTIDLTASAITSGSSANASGSIAYSYWKDSLATVAISSPNTSNAIQDSGKYYIKAVNSKGCSVSKSVIATINTLPSIAQNTTTTSSICETGTKTLSGLPSGGSWSIVSGGGSISGTTYTPANATSNTNVTVRYTIASNGACPATTSDSTFVVNFQDTAQNTTSTSSICETGTKTLSGLPSGGSWSIVSGGGSITGTTYTPANATSNTNVTVRYTIASNGACPATTSDSTFVVNFQDTAQNTTTTSSICETGTKTLSGLPSGGSWSIVSGGGSITGTTYTPANVTSNTNVTVRYTIASNGACPATTSDSTFVVNFQDTALNTTTTSSICETGTKTLSGLPSGGSWSVVSGGGSITGTTYTSANATSNTNVTVRYTIASNGACPATTSDSTFVVNFQDTAQNTTSTSSICETDTKTLTGLPSGGSWSIVSGGGSITGTTYTPANATSNTNVTVRYTIASNGACPATTSDSTFVVNFQDTAQNTTSTSSICETDTKTLSGLPSGGSWSIVSGGGSITGTTYTPANATSNTNVTVRYTIASNGACPATTSDSTFVVNFQDTAQNTTTTSSICETGTKTLSGLPSGGSWSIVSGGGSISGTTYTPANATSNTNVTVRYTIASNGACPATTSDSTFVVNFQDTAQNTTSTSSICETDTKTLTGLPSGGSWSIVSGGGSITGTTYTSANATSNTNVTVRYTIASNGACPATTSDSTFVVKESPNDNGVEVINQTCELKTGMIVIKNREANTLYSIDSINYFAKDTFDFLYANTYKIYAKHQNNCQITFAKTEQIDSIQRPGMILSKISGDSVVVKGSIIQFSIDSVVNATSYSWNVPNSWIIATGGGLFSNVINVKVGDSSGNIIVTANNLPCTSNTVIKFVTVISDKEDTIKVKSYMDSLKKIYIADLINYSSGGYTVSFTNGLSPKNGTLNLNNVDSLGNLIYTPNTGFIGIDSAEIIICKNGNCKKVFIYFTIIPYFDPGNFVYNNYNVSLMQNSEAKIPVISSSSKTYFKVSKTPNNGTVSIDSVSGTIVYIKDNAFCGMDSIQITIRYEFSNSNIEDIEYKYWVYIINHCDNSFPNFISPNEDGINDKFVIPSGYRNKFPNLKLSIYNRWGNIVWRSIGSYKDDFNGTNQFGDIIPDGVYFYIIELEDYFKSFNTGFIQIMRD